jgi:hypothetical protein
MQLHQVCAMAIWHGVLRQQLAVSVALAGLSRPSQLLHSVLSSLSCCVASAPAGHPLQGPAQVPGVWRARQGS